MKYTVILEPQDEEATRFDALNCQSHKSRRNERGSSDEHQEAIGLVLEVLNQDLEVRSNAEILKVELADVC